MSQRRGGPKDTMVTEELVPFSAALDDNKPIAMGRDSAEPLSSSSTPNSVDGLGAGAVADSTSLDDRLDAESQYQQQRIKQWKEGPFATGFTEQTWEADYNKFRHNLGGECSKCMDNDDTMPCGCCSAIVCSALGAGRVGNIAVLKETEERGEDGERKRKLLIVAGPYWPMLMFVTYPLIFGVSGVTLFTAIPKAHPAVALVWTILTVGLIVALGFTAFRDPGILPRYDSPPPDSEGGQLWRWNDRAHTFRPKGAWYDPDTAVVVEEFDHTCPWTGTAIGRKNMLSFQSFVCLVFVCLFMNIILLTGGVI